MLTIARLESGEFTYDIRPLDLTDVVYRAVAALTDTSDVPVELAIADRIPLVLADEDRQTQILNNLLSNAVKFSTTATPIHVSVTQQADQVVVAVRNHGNPIPSEQVPQLFQRFVRLHESTLRSASGTGLGLYIARALVEGQGGRIWVDSSEVAGTTFSYSVPATTHTETS